MLQKTPAPGTAVLEGLLSVAQSRMASWYLQKSLEERNCLGRSVTGAKVLLRERLVWKQNRQVQQVQRLAAAAAAASGA